MEEVGDGEAVEETDVTNMGVDGLVSGVRGEPCIWSQHSSQTFARVTGDVGLSKANMGTCRGGWRKSRFETSRRWVSLEVQR